MNDNNNSSTIYKLFDSKLMNEKNLINDIPQYIIQF